MNLSMNEQRELYNDNLKQIERLDKAKTQLVGKIKKTRDDMDELIAIESSLEICKENLRIYQDNHPVKSIYGKRWHDYLRAHYELRGNTPIIYIPAGQWRFGEWGWLRPIEQSFNVFDPSPAARIETKHDIIKLDKHAFPEWNEQIVCAVAHEHFFAAKFGNNDYITRWR